jgi:maltooligosyltrehalose trehalohydrolase
MKHRRYSQGAEVTENGVSFRTWTTNKKSVSVVVLNSDRQPIRELPLSLDQRGYYTVEDPQAKAGMLYQSRWDGRLLPDPASWFQPYGVHGPSQIVDSTGFAWSDQGWKPPTIAELVIYELHVGTFTRDGSFRSIIDHFDHLLRLGVNTIELMPIADFPGDRNWGYDGVEIFAPCRAYGNPDDLRFFINEAHRAGLAVILDVVYNHLGPDGNYLGSYSKTYFNPEHHTPWGLAFNFDCRDCAPVRSFFVEMLIDSGVADPALQRFLQFPGAMKQMPEFVQIASDREHIAKTVGNLAHFRNRGKVLRGGRALASKNIAGGARAAHVKNQQAPI